MKPVGHDVHHNSCLTGTVVLHTSLFIHSCMWRYQNKQIVSCQNINVLCTASKAFIKHCKLKSTLNCLRLSSMIPSFCSLLEPCYLHLFIAWTLKHISILCFLVSCMYVHKHEHACISVCHRTYTLVDIPVLHI